MLSTGSDASAASIEWTMSELLRKPPVLKKVQNELEHVVGFKCMVQESNLPSLRYLQAAMKETLRLHPPGPISLPHVSVEDCTMLGYEIPRGTRLLMNFWAIGSNPRS
jgi:cytochrome P450